MSLLFDVTSQIVIFNLPKIEAIIIDANTTIKIPIDKSDQNQIIVTLPTVDLAFFESFDQKPFVVKGKKLYFVQEGSVNRKRFFKKVKRIQIQ